MFQGFDIADFPLCRRQDGCHAELGRVVVTVALTCALTPFDEHVLEFVVGGRILLEASLGIRRGDFGSNSLSRRVRCRQRPYWRACVDVDEGKKVRNMVIRSWSILLLPERDGFEMATISGTCHADASSRHVTFSSSRNQNSEQTQLEVTSALRHDLRSDSTA